MPLGPVQDASGKLGYGAHVPIEVGVGDGLDDVVGDGLGDVVGGFDGLGDGGRHRRHRDLHVNLVPSSTL